MLLPKVAYRQYESGELLQSENDKYQFWPVIRCYLTC